MRRIVVIAALVLAVLGALAIRVVVAGRAALATGEELLAAGKPAEAIRSFEASARWYLPLAPHVDEAYARLRELASSGDPRVTLAAWRAIRSAARASRSLWTPHADDLAAADAAIAKLAAADPEGATSEGDATAREAWHQARLSRDARASTAAAVVAALGILLWLAGAVQLARRGLTAGGSVARRWALASAVMIVVGLVCWFAGLYNA